MRFWPVGLLPLAALSLTSPTLPLATSSALLLTSTVSLVTASNLNPTINQRNFRLGRPAAHLNHHAKPLTNQRLSTMSTSNVLPEQTDNFEGFDSQPRLEPSSQSTQLIKDAMDLFSAKPCPTIFARSWSCNAIFADPICHAQGSRQYLAQWYGMPAAFAHSETLAWKLTKQQQDQVQYVQKQRYKVKGLGVTKDMISTVVMQLDPATGKIVRFEDRWNHKPLGGFLSWPFRRLNALTLPLFVGVPKETKNALDTNDRKHL